jgi:Xaa-Pro aminopeptidase
LQPGKSLEEIRQAGAHFREHGAQARPMMVHGLDLITAPPFVYVDQVKAQPFEQVLVPNMTLSVEITPINADGTFGMFMGRTYAITEEGQRDLTRFPMDEIIVV